MSRLSVRNSWRSAGVGALGLLGLILAAQLLAVPAAPVEANVAPAQRTVLATPVTPRPTATRSVSGPSRPSFPIVTPTRTPLPRPSPVVPCVGCYSAGVLLTPATPVPPTLTPIPWWVTVGRALLPVAEGRQVIQFNPNAALQKRIFADGLVPNSPEFSVSVGGTEYVGQRAESLQSRATWAYYVAAPAWGDVRRVERLAAWSNAEEVVLFVGDTRQVMQFNPDAAIQKRIFADGFVPTSPEFTQAVGGATYVGQRAERLDTGQVRVYFVRSGQWNSVYFATRR